MVAQRQVRLDPGGRVLVIGLGFIGTHIAGALARAGVATTALTRSGVPGWGATLPVVTVVRGDAADPAALNLALDGASHVVYCAGSLMPAASNVNPAADISLALPPLVAVLEALRRRPGTGLTFISSGGTVYGHPSRLPVPESHPTDPITSYGVMKLASEKYIGMYEQLYGLSARILRCSNVYGEGQSPYRGQGAVATFLHRALADEPLVVFGDGSVVRDYLYVGDLAGIVLELIALAGGPALLNVGTGVGTSLLDLLAVVTSLVEAETGRPVRVEHRPPRSFDVDSIVLDTTALRRVVRFDPTPLEAGVRKTWEGLRLPSASGR